jgi:hemin uptake protein HemP
MNSAEETILKPKPTYSQPSKHSIQPSAYGPGLPCVRSEDLIGKDREIMIEHIGVYYRLRITRANKLILTK